MKEAIVLYPAPGIGHIVSMVELGKLILTRYNHKFSITILLTSGFLDTPAIAPYIRNISQSHPCISFVQFPFQPVDTTPTRSRPAIAFDFIRLNKPNVLKSLQEISKSSAIKALVIDLFCTSALSTGKELNIPTFYFFTSGAAALAAYLYFPKIQEGIGESFKNLKQTVLEFPGMSPLNAPHMPEPVLVRDDPAYWDMLYFCSHLPKSDGIIANTFDALEPIAIKAIADGVCVPDAPTPPVYYIGPLIAQGDEKASKEEKGGSEEGCLLWLDKQPSQSVVFLCFGSRGSFTPEQIREIANGLEKSGQRFLWVLKKPPANETKQTEDVADFDWEGLFPDGFLERTKDRGLVVKSWAPQVAVLKKEAVGGFVTHCGWNSALEAVVAGVPMVAWPLYSEQHLNRNAMVKDMGIAVAVEQRDGDGFVSGDEVERSVRELMEGEHGREVRQHCKKMKEMALASWGEFGSSATALQKFINSIS
ncbi:hypothetical protein UlMin_034633 [Ulmus minor]